MFKALKPIVTNRKQRRNPTHPVLPIQYASNKKVTYHGYKRVKANTKPKGIQFR